MRLRRKILSVLLTGTLICTALTGCGDKTNKEKAEKTAKETVESSGKVELKVWAEKEDFDVTNKMIDSFKKKYEGQAEFDIKLEEMSGADTKNNLLDSVHDAADVFSLPDDQLISMIAAGAIAPVANPDEVKSANLDEAVDAASYEDTLYAYPYSADNGYFLYYNKKYLKDSDVKSLEKILSVAKKHGKKMQMQLELGWYLYSFFGNTGLNFSINSDGVTNSCNWNAKTGDIKGVDVAKALLNLTSNPAFDCENDDSFVKNAKDDKVIAGISGIWSAMGIKEAWGDDYGACKLPTYTCAGKQVQMASFLGYKMMGVNAYSSHPEWAQKLADWMTNEENQTLRFQERSQGPSNKKASESEEVKKVPAIQALIDQSQYGSLQRVANSYWDACSSFASTIEAGNPGNKSLQKLMDTLVKGITKSVTE